MSMGGQLYLFVVLATFGGFGFWLAYNSMRFDRAQAGKPVVRYRAEEREAPDSAIHA